MRSTFQKISLLILGLVLTFGAHAQCSMCKAVAESSLNGGSSFAIGLNNGILYLMAFPYILLAAIGFIWYKNKKAQKA